MLINFLVYFGPALVILVTLVIMLLRISGDMSDCPQRGKGLRSAGVAIATGYWAIGLGGIILIAAGIAAVDFDSLAALFLGLGFACLCLGLGFANAVATLRAVSKEIPA
ncbi:hypothetical protein [Algirhabdus cladophorae]|uniref:hypothetical protein n=1 Tax=Algirhabdus cladophorae TaxID=3377108 RepID=UPI003B8492E9